MRKLYSLKLSSEERHTLEALTRKKRIAASKVLKARALLLADESPEGKALKAPFLTEAFSLFRCGRGRRRICLGRCG